MLNEAQHNDNYCLNAYTKVTIITVIIIHVYKCPVNDLILESCLAIFFYVFLGVWLGFWLKSQFFSHFGTEPLLPGYLPVLWPICWKEYVLLAFYF